MPPTVAGPPVQSRAAAAVTTLVDVVAALLVLAVLLVPLLAVALAVRLSSPGPVLFRQTRVGRDRVPFTMLKFRTMPVATDDRALRDLVAREMSGEDTRSGGSTKLPTAPGTTPVGAWLRRTSLDELPQLINVLRREMTLVGPRPCLPWEAEMFPAEAGLRFCVRPGITGLWQVTGRSTLATPAMLALDVEYVRARGIRSDLGILVRTVPVVLRGSGAR